MNKFLKELKRRNVIKSSLAYLVVSWVLLQVFSLLLPMAEAPEWVLKTLTLVMVIVFPLWVVFSWTYEITPEGIKRTAQVSKDDSISATTNKRLNILILIALLVAITVGLFFRPLSNDITSNTTTAVTIFNKSIAVLPFDDMSSEGDTEWFCDGVTEDILTNLSKIKELKVISRTSTERYKQTDKSIPEIAKELGVSYVLEGSVRKHNNKVIITAQLIDANDKHMWADNFNDDFDEVFKIQQEVSQKIVEQLKITISPEEEKALKTSQTNNVEAYQFYLKGRSIADGRTEEGLKNSIAFYQQAIEIDPNYAEAYAEMANSYYLMEIYEFLNKNEGKEKAEIYVKKALEINPNTVRAYTVTANIEMDDNKWESAGENFKNAIALNPNDATAHHHYAIYFRDSQVPNYNEFLIQINLAAELDPFSMPINAVKIQALIINNKIEEAEAIFNSKKTLFQDSEVTLMENYFSEKKAERIGVDNKDRTKTVLFLQTEVDKNPNNDGLNYNLALAYDGILNDDINYVKYTKKAYELDSSNVTYAREYFTALSENGQFEDAQMLYDSENYKNITSETQKLQSLYYLYYNQKEYKKSLEVMNNSLLKNISHYPRLVVYAQLDETEKVYDILKNQNISIASTALVYAILKEKDSMYAYLNKEDMNYNFINGRREFDPYRNEEQFKAVLEKYYLPNPPIDTK